jgi:hypothetical protein
MPSRQGTLFQTANMPPRLKRRQAGTHFQRASPKGPRPLNRFPSCLSRGYWQKEGGVIRGTAEFGFAVLKKRPLTTWGINP